MASNLIVMAFNLLARSQKDPVCHGIIVKLTNRNLMLSARGENVTARVQLLKLRSLGLEACMFSFIMLDAWRVPAGLILLGTKVCA